MLHRFVLNAKFCRQSVTDIWVTTNPLFKISQACSVINCTLLSLHISYSTNGSIYQQETVLLRNLSSMDQAFL